MKIESLTPFLALLLVCLNQATAQVPYLSPPMPVGYDQEGPRSVLVRPDGSLIVNGFFSFSSGESHCYLVLLDPQGRVLRRIPSQYHGALAALPDGGLLVLEAPDDQLRRLKPDGSLDGDFGAHFGTHVVEYLRLLPDGRSLVRVAQEGGSAGQLRRILPDGSSDEASDQAFRERLAAQGLRSETMYGFRVHPDGRILSWTSSPGRDRLVRLWPDGMGPGINHFSLRTR